MSVWHFVLRHEIILLFAKNFLAGVTLRRTVSIQLISKIQTTPGKPIPDVDKFNILRVTHTHTHLLKGAML